MKTKTRLFALIGLIAFTILSFNLNAENAAFELVGFTADDITPLSDVKVTVYEGSILMTEYSTSSNGKFVFDLAFNKNFKITMEKEGFAAEDLSINTTIPQEFSKQKISYQIALKMFFLSKTIPPFIFEEAVAKIFFHPVVKTFISEIKYKKTFQEAAFVEQSDQEQLGNAGISREFKYELTLRRHQPVKKEEIKVKEEKTEEKLAVNEIVAVQISSPKEIIATPVEVSAPENKITVAKMELAVNTEIVLPHKKEEVITNKNKKQPFIAIEKKKVSIPVEIAKKELKKPGSETITQLTRVINSVVVLKNGRPVEYTQIIYNKGGVYYFKNGSSISSYAFEKEIQLSE